MAFSLVKKPGEKRSAPIQGSTVANYSPVPPCTLVFLNSARNVPEGTELGLETSYISMGRNHECLISFGEEYQMVSRLHAAIEWYNGSFTLCHLSETNQTLVNGKTVMGKGLLRDGDIIQLAPFGPKLKFKVSEVQAKKIKKSLDTYQLATITVVCIAVLLLVFLVFF